MCFHSSSINKNQYDPFAKVVYTYMFRSGLWEDFALSMDVKMTDKVFLEQYHDPENPGSYGGIKWFAKNMELP